MRDGFRHGGGIGYVYSPAEIRSEWPRSLNVSVAVVLCPADYLVTHTGALVRARAGARF